MKNIAAVVMMGSVALLLAACGVPAENWSPEQSLEQSPGQWQAVAPPQLFFKTELQCEDGRRFSIAFTRDDNEAVLVFSGQTQSEVLRNAMPASGIEYGNSDYVFRQYRGRATLTDLTQDRETTVACRKTDAP